MIPNKLHKTLYHTTAIELADLVVEKQKAYGDSFGKSGAIIKILYPNGIPIEQYDDALTIVRIIDKLFRLATKKDAFGESPWKDIMGYALLAANRNRIEEVVTTTAGYTTMPYQTAYRSLLKADYKPLGTRSAPKRTKTSPNHNNGLKGHIKQKDVK